MPSPDALWVRLATDYYLDPAIMDVGERGELLFVRAMAFVGGRAQDGFISHGQLAAVGKGMRTGPLAAKLVKSGLFAEVSGGFVLTNFTKWQQTRDEIADKRAANAARQAAYRARRKGQA